MQGIGNVTGTQASQSAGNANPVSLQDLKKQYPHLKLSAQSFGSEAAIRSYAMKQSGKYNVAIDPRALSRMGEDGEFSDKIHDILSNVKEWDDWSERQTNAMGARVIAKGTIIDKDGNVSSWGIVQTGDGNGKDFASSSKSKEDLLERVAKRREERKAEEKKRLEESREAEKAASESLEVNVSVESDQKTVTGPASPAVSGSLDVEA